MRLPCRPLTQSLANRCRHGPAIWVGLEGSSICYLHYFCDGPCGIIQDYDDTKEKTGWVFLKACQHVPQPHAAGRLHAAVPSAMPPLRKP